MTTKCNRPARPADNRGGSRRRPAVVVVAFVLAAAVLAGCQSGSGGSASGGEGSAAPRRTTATGQYQRLRDQVKAGDLSVDFTELRFAYTLTPQFDGTGAGTYKQIARLGDGFDDHGDGTTWLLNQTRRLTDRHYPDIGWHVMLASLYQDGNNWQQANFHLQVIRQLLFSIDASGDGQTLASAFMVVSVPEMQWYMRLRGMHPLDSELVKRNGHTVARVRVERPDARYGIGLVYFNLDAPAEDIRNLQTVLRETSITLPDIPDDVL